MPRRLHLAKERASGPGASRAKGRAVIRLVSRLARPRAAAGVEPRPIEGGLVSGGRSKDGKVCCFLGLPYAAPPVGELRWRPPAPVRPWKGVRAATAYAPSALPAPPPAAPPPEGVDEDCLHLNVWTSAEPGETRRPVFLWFHGGGYTEGSGARPDYHGEALCRLGLVVVTVNYRLNVFGFLAHPELSRESPRGVSGNYALLDMLAALNWVRRNIHVFGGDPDRITIAGESAGSVSVSALTVSPKTKGKIAGAIAQSVVLVDSPRLAEMEEAGVRFVRRAGAKSVAELRRWPAARLVEAFVQHGDELTCRPLIDDWLLHGDTLTSLARGRRQDIPLLTGFNADEASWMPAISLADFRAQARRIYGKLAARYLALYPARTDAEATTAQIAAAQDRVTWEHLMWARLHGRRGQHVFAYCFTRATPLAPDRRRLRPLGAFHTAEIPYVFNNLARVDHPWKPYDHRLARVLSAYWANFAKHANPNGRGLPTWPEFGHSTGLIMELGEHITPRPASLSPEKLAFWTADHAAAAPRSAAARRERRLRF